MVFKKIPKSIVYVWVSQFISSSIHFYFPLLILYILDLGHSQAMASFILSSSMVWTLISRPVTTIYLDRNQGGMIFLLSGIGILFGLVGFLFHDDFHISIYIISVWTFVAATSAMYAAASRITEGFAPKNELAKYSALTYVVTNASLGTSALIAFLYADQFITLLVLLDGLATTMFIIVLYKIGIKHYTVPKNDINKQFSFFHYLLNGFKKFKDHHIVLIAILLLLIVTVSFLSGLQILYNNVTDFPKRFSSIQMAANTFSMVIFGLIFSKKLDSYSYYLRFVISALFLGLGYCFAPFHLNIHGIIITTVISCIGSAILYPTLTAYILQFFNKGEEGLAVGFKDIVIRAGMILSPVVFSVTSPDEIQIFSSIYFIVSLGAFSIFLFKRKEIN